MAARIRRKGEGNPNPRRVRVFPLPGNAGSAQGQIFLEAALVLPLMIFLFMGVIQVLYLGYAAVRVEAAAHAAARAAISLGDTDPDAYETIKNAALMRLIPVSPRLSGILAHSSLNTLSGGYLSQLSQLFTQGESLPLGGPLIQGIDRYFYAYRYTRVCYEKGSWEEDEDEPVQGMMELVVEFRVPLFFPLVDRFLGEDDQGMTELERFAWEQEWGKPSHPEGNRFLDMLPLLENLAQLLSASQILSIFSQYPKRTVRARYPVFFYPGNAQNLEHLLNSLKPC